MSHYVYGAEEFAYVLGTCLVNYGGLIGASMMHSAFQRTRTQKANFDGGPPNEQEFKKEESSMHFEKQPSSHGHRHDFEGKTRPMAGSFKSYSPPKQSKSTTSSQKPSQPSSKWSWKPTQPPPTGPTQNESDAHDEELRLQIQNMKVDLDDHENLIDWTEVAGLETTKIALDEFASFFLHFPHLTRSLRQRSTTGILLFGPQGTGKTLLIKSFAKKYNLSLYDIRASAIMSKFVGESEKFIRALFKEVRANTPSILMLDECDGLLCNPSMDSSQSHSYRLLQNEMKNQWSDLIYSRDEVIVVGATNKPHDIDMDGFGRRLSLKLHVDLPTARSCVHILKGSLGRLRHFIEDTGMEALGHLCHERGLSGYDIDCLVEGQLRKAIREIAVSEYFLDSQWHGERIIIPCKRSDPGAQKGPWVKLTGEIEQVSYCPFVLDDIRAAVLRARPTVDEQMNQRHIQFASQYGTDFD